MNSSSSSAPLVQRIVNDFFLSLSSSTTDDLEQSTNERLEEIRGLYASDAALVSDLCSSFFSRLSSLPSSHVLFSSSSPHRRSFARTCDLLVDLLGPSSCPPVALKLLLESALETRAPEESVVAREVLLAVLATGEERGWEMLIQAYLQTQRPEQYSRILGEAFARFPKVALAKILSLLKQPSSRLSALKALAESASSPEAASQAASEALSFLRHPEDDADGEMLAAGGAAASTLLRSADIREAIRLADDAAGAAETLLCWRGSHGAQVRAAGAALLFHAYAARPRETLRRIQAGCAANPTLAAACGSLLGAHSVPLHPQLMLPEEAAAAVAARAGQGATGMTLWTELWTSHTKVPGQYVLRTTDKEDDDATDEPWEELQHADELITEAAEEIESIASRKGLFVLPYAPNYMESERDDAVSGSRSSSVLFDAQVRESWLRSQLAFERVLRTSLLARMRQEEESSLSRGAPTVAVAGGHSGSLGSAATHSLHGAKQSGRKALHQSATDIEVDTDVEDADEVVQNQNASVVERLKTMLRSAREELASRDVIEGDLRARVLLLEREAEERELKMQKEKAVVEKSGEVDQLESKLGEMESRLLEAETELKHLRSQLRNQQEYERELASLQADVIDWEEHDTAARVAQHQGVDSAALLDAAKQEIVRLENSLMEAQQHYHAALGEVAGLTAVTNAAMSDVLRADKETEQMKRTLTKMAESYQERLVALEDKYANLQELHAGLLLELQKKQTKK